MLRRLGILGILVLSLSGFVPVAWACAAAVQQMDCCPADQPCDEEDVPESFGSDVAACCSVQPSPAQAAVATVSQKESSFEHEPTPDQWVVAAGAVSQACSMPALDRHAKPIPSLKSNQQQIYLLTGRLRL